MTPRGLALFVAIALAACELPRSAPPSSPPPPPAEDARVARARTLLEAAAREPVPTPPPPPSPKPRHWVPQPSPEFKPSELEAIHILEEAAAADPGRPEAHEILAGVLERTAMARHESTKDARTATRKKPAPPAPPDQGVDATPARVSRAYRAAVAATPGGAGPVIERFIRFAVAVDDLTAADWAYQERIRREKENASAGPLEQYGDFLLDVRKDPLAAAEQYRNVLMWKPADARVRGQLAGIYLAAAREHLDKKEWSAAESRVKEAAKYVDKGTPAASVLAGYQSRLSAIRR